MMNRSEHVEWCKKRALQYVDAGDVNGAFLSMTSDLRKHEETREHIGIDLGMIQMLSGNLSSPEKMRHFIEGFN